MIEKDSRRAKLLDVFAQTLQEQLLKRTFTNSNHVSMLSRVYTKRLIEIFLSDIKFVESEKMKLQKIILPFVTQYHPAVLNLKHILWEKWHLIQNHPSLWQIFLGPLLISFNPSVSVSALMTPQAIDFTLSNARRFYSSMGNPSDTEELTTPKTMSPLKEENPSKTCSKERNFRGQWPQIRYRSLNRYGVV